MCRTTDYPHHHHHHHTNHLFYNDHGNYLRLKSFTLNLSLLSSTTSSYFPEFLTLVFLPRITVVHDTLLEINGSKIRPDSPAFVTLHRTLCTTSPNGSISFVSKDRVVASDGAAFEVHVGDGRLLKGLFREPKDHCTAKWSVECKSCVCESDCEFVGAKEFEVSAVCDSGFTIRERVEMKRYEKQRCGKKERFKLGLEVIPEERECDVEGDEERSDGGECGCWGGEDGSDGEEEEEELMKSMVESEMDGVKWAVDLGIWVACFGVGFLVSRASARRFLRGKRLV